MARDAAELSRRLARDAEAVCRHYLPNGRRQGQYWTIGDARNTPGRSMFVRLKADGFFSEIIRWKLRLFCPTDPTGIAVLDRLLARCPVTGLHARGGC